LKALVSKNAAKVAALYEKLLKAKGPGVGFSLSDSNPRPRAPQAPMLTTTPPRPTRS